MKTTKEKMIEIIAHLSGIVVIGVDLLLPFDMPDRAVILAIGLVLIAMFWKRH
jgi:hypothetical protein